MQMIVSGLNEIESDHGCDVARKMGLQKAKNEHDYRCSNYTVTLSVSSETDNESLI